MRIFLRTLLTLCCLAGINIAYGQNTYVSKPIVDAINGGKYYMKLTGEADVEMAARNGDVLSRSSAMGIRTTMLSSSGNVFRLNEDAKTWSLMTSMNGKMDMGRLTFAKQYLCRVNGKDGWFCDEYRTTTGQKVRFYYNTNKVSAIEVDDSGVQWLTAFSCVIPQNMYFCLGSDWKRESSTEDLKDTILEGAGINMNTIMAQIDEDDLPPGMTKAAMAKMIESRMKGAGVKAGVKQGAAAKTSNAVPPQCNTPWHDSGTAVNLAYVSESGTITVSGMQPTSSAVYASSMPQAGNSSIDSGSRWDISGAGVNAALANIRKTIENMSDSEALYYITARNNDIMTEIESETATGQTLEEAIATTIAYPTSLTLNNTGLLFMKKNEPESALQYFLEAEKLDPKNSIILNNIAEAYLCQDNILLAERYAGLALQQQPNYGAAQQTMATINFKKGKNGLGFNWLLKSSKHYFSNVSALQMFYVSTLVDLLKADAVERDMYSEFQQIYSYENVALLRELMRGDGQYNHQGVNVNETIKYPWPVKDASMGKFYRKKALVLDREQQKWKDKIDSLTVKEGCMIVLYETMGMRDIKASVGLFSSKIDNAMAKARQQLNVNMSAKAREALNEKLKSTLSTSSLPDPKMMMQAYEAISKMVANGQNASFITDARQYWALVLWQQYNQFLMEYASGKMSTFDKEGKLRGTFAQEYADYEENLHKAEVSANAALQMYKQTMENISNEHKAVLESLPKPATTKVQKLKEHIAIRKSELNVKKRSLEAIKVYTSRMESVSGARLRAYRQLYEAKLSPTMTENWYNMSSATRYCHDQDVINYFHYSAMIENSRCVQTCYDETVNYANSLHMYRRHYKQTALQYGIEIQEMEEDIRRLEGELKEAENEPPQVDEVFAFPSELFVSRDLVIGSVEASVSVDGKFSVGFTNNWTGESHKFNVTDEEHTCTQIYPVVTDEERNGRTDAQILRDNVKKDIAMSVMGKVPGLDKAAEVAGKVESARQFGSVSDTKFKSYTVDAAGNRHEIAHGMTSEMNLTYNGNGGKLGQTVMYTGNVKIVKFHATATYQGVSVGIR